MRSAQRGSPVAQWTSAEAPLPRMNSSVAPWSSGGTAARSHATTSTPRARSSAASAGATVPFMPVTMARAMDTGSERR